jgi:transcription initiation factor TFIIIB Brf1 subunit/transcription initiation factor TFIIB
MYRAGTERAEAELLADLDRMAERLDLDGDARSVAQELYLTQQPVSDRSKRPLLAACLYAGSLVAGEQRSQVAVAEVAGVSRLSIQSRWQELLEDAGFESPSW